MDPDVPDEQLDSNDGGLGMILLYDTRDNTFSPNRGIKAELELMRHDDAFGGDFDYNDFKAEGQFYFGLHPDFTLGWRLDGRAVNGDVPFYGLPYIDLRGIPAMRYQGDQVAVTELEGRWDFTFRWSAVGFTGVGRTWSDEGVQASVDASDPKYIWGGGLRYLLARQLNMRAGFDIARGPEQTVFYLTFGSAWN